MHTVSNAAKYLPGVMLAAILFPLAVAYSWRVHAPCDDAYIFLVYARSFVEGNGLTYNGARVEGFTSPLWVALLALLGLSRVPLPVLAENLSRLSGLLALWATYRLGRSLRLSSPWALLAPALLAATGDVAFYMSSGLEQVLFTALAPLCLAQALSEEPGALLRSLRFPVTMAAMILTRPEGILVAALLLVMLAWSSRSPTAAVRCASVLSAMLVPFLVARWVYYGDWLPNPYHVKGDAGLANLDRGMSYVRYTLQRYAAVLYPVVGLTVVAVLRRRGEMIVQVLLPLVIFGWWVAYVAVVGGDNMVGGRVLLPALPFLYVSLARLATLIPFQFAGAGTLLVGVLLLHAYRSDDIVKSHIDGWRREYEIRWRAGTYLREHFGPDTLVALNPAGIIPYYSRLPTIDMLGLNDAYIAHHGKRDRSLGFAHQAGDGAYVLSRKPDVILFGGTLTRNASQLISDREIWASPEFHRDYQLQEWPVGSAYVRRKTSTPSDLP